MKESLGLRNAAHKRPLRLSILRVFRCAPQENSLCLPASSYIDAFLLVPVPVEGNFTYVVSGYFANSWAASRKIVYPRAKFASLAVKRLSTAQALNFIPNDPNESLALGRPNQPSGIYFLSESARY